MSFIRISSLKIAKKKSDSTSHLKQNLAMECATLWILNWSVPQWHERIFICISWNVMNFKLLQVFHANMRRLFPNSKDKHYIIFFIFYFVKSSFIARNWGCSYFIRIFSSHDSMFGSNIVYSFIWFYYCYYFFVEFCLTFQISFITL